MSEQPRFGIWGGRLPGGWCHIYLRDRADHGGYWGTQAEAEEGLAVFMRENNGLSYAVVPFDPLREPPATSDAVMSAAQFTALQLVSTYSSQRWYTEVAQRTVRALHDRGWIFNPVNDKGTDKGLSVTAAGRRAMERYTGL